jgi:hypothetical protein
LLDESLAEKPDLYFEVGDHRELIHMRARRIYEDDGEVDLA